MMICVNSEFLGTRQHLIYQVDDGEYYWSTHVPEGTWIFGSYNSLYSLDTLFELLRVEKPVIAVDAHIKSFKVLSQDILSDIPWHQVLPPHEFKRLILKLITGLEGTLRGFIKTNYMETFISKRTTLLSLSRAVVDRPLLASYIRDEENATVRSTLRTFLPDHDLRTRPIVYNQTGTVTGRLTVKSGPQVLTLPKKYRDILVSKHPSGSIVQVDFTSLEPRVARLATGLSANDDVYMQLSHELFNSDLKREEVKIAVLCALYGVSKRRLSKMVGKKFKADTIIREIREFFGIPKLVKSLRAQLSDDHKIRNHFGRIIEPDKAEDNILVNYYVQSSATDASILGFQCLLNSISDLDIDPLFIIHDALVLDVSPDSMQKLGEVIKNGIDVPTMGNFPVELSTINDSRE